MRLIYVNEIGEDYKGQRQYEFIFSTHEEIDMEEWFTVPASLVAHSQCPDGIYIDTVGLLKNSDLVLELVQNSDYFGVIDAVDGVIALAWEKLDVESTLPRLYFKTGETFENVVKKLEKRNYKLIIEQIKT